MIVNPPGTREQLQACMRLLRGLGEAGEIVWELGRLYTQRAREPYTQQQRLAYLKMAISHLKEKAQESRRWRTLPVDVQTFVDSPRLLNKMGAIWPEVFPYLKELNSGRYAESVLTGGIGVAKSTMAIYTQVNQVYILSCMATPHEDFELDPASEILIVIQSISQKVASDVDYTRMRAMVEGSPYFNEVFPFRKDRTSELLFPRRIIIRPVAGHDTAAIGSNVIGGILDEVNFMSVVEDSKQTKGSTEFDQAKQNYDSIAERRRSRFLNQGTVPGMLCLVSSRNYPGQFTDTKEAQRQRQIKETGRSTIFLYDMVTWVLRPHRFSDQKFRVFVGDATRKPRILKDDYVPTVSELPLIKEVPIDYKESFENNLLEALRSIAGVATQAMTPFMMNTDMIAKAFKPEHRSILSRDECDFDQMELAILRNRFRNKDRPRFVHLDMSRKRDAFGIACSHVPRFKEVRRGAVLEKLPVIDVDFLLRVLPPKGGEIPYERVRKLLYVLRDLGLPVKWVSADEYQSTDMLQILGQQGFIVGRQSMDCDTKAYDVTRQALYDERVLAPECPVVQTELARLEFVPKTNKIDHPVNGSKDGSDALAGTVYGLTMRTETWRDFDISTREIPASVTDKRPGTTQADDYMSRRRAAVGLDRLEDRRREEAAGAGVPVWIRDEPDGVLGRP